MLFGKRETKCERCGNTITWDAAEFRQEIFVTNCECGEVVWLPTGEILQPVGDFYEDGERCDTYRLPDGRLVYDAIDGFLLVTVEVVRIDNNQVEFRCGDSSVAYGTWENPEIYSVDHAPTQQDFDVVASALDNGARVEFID